MTSSSTDRFSGTPSGSDATPKASAVRDGLAIKAPVKAATTANITLSGEQTIDGVSCATGDRVLVKNQTTTSQNGVYEVSTGAWSRTIDFDGNNDIVEGTLIPVNLGTLYADTIWRVATSSPSIGSALSITRASVDTSGYLPVSGGTISGSLEVTGRISGNGAVKPGTVEMFGGPVANIPSGYLFCNGSAISRSTYADLFAAIGTMHGAGDGSTTFNLPDYRDKFAIGARQDDSGVAKTNVTGSLSSSGGSKDSVVVSHTHTATVTDPGHAHDVNYQSTNLGAGGGTRSYWTRDGAGDALTNRTATGAAASVTTGITVGVSTNGSSGTNANLPPYVGIVFMIKT